MREFVASVLRFVQHKLYSFGLFSAGDRHWTLDLVSYLVLLILLLFYIQSINWWIEY